MAAMKVFCLLAALMLVASPVCQAQAPAPATSGDSIVTVATGLGGFENLIAAAQYAGLANTLSDPSAALTVFAPIDSAFEELGLTADNFTAGTVPFTQTEVAQILSYHVVEGVATSSQLTDGQVLSTLLPAQTLTVLLSDGTVMIDGALDGGATVVDADVPAGAGIIHAIDAVLLPNLPFLASA